MKHEGIYIGKKVKKTEYNSSKKSAEDLPLEDFTAKIAKDD